MLITTLSYKEDKDGLSDDIVLMINHFKNRGIKIGISEKISKDIHFLNLYTDEEVDIDNYNNSLYYYIARIIYGVILEEYERQELSAYIEENFFFLDGEELKNAKNSCLVALKGEEISEKNISILNIKSEIIKKILECLKENNSFNLDGFILFRRKEIFNDFRKILESVIENLVIEKEYDEFIKLLKHFIEMEDPKLPEVNIIIKNDGGFKITDEKGKSILSKLLQNINEICIAENPTTEDMVISSLISCAPQRIIIHCRENIKNKEVIETIEKIFGNRVTFCETCNLCKRIKRGC